MSLVINPLAEKVLSKMDTMDPDNIDASMFPKFDILELEHIKNMSVAIYGKRRTGKTVALRGLLSQIKHWYSDVYVFSSTAGVQREPYNFAPKENVFNSFNEEKLLEIYDSQAKYIDEEMRYKPKATSESEYKKKLNYTLLIFDDVIGDDKVRSSSTFKNLFTLGRHYNFAIFVLSQEMGGRGGLPKPVRANLDLAISFFLNAENDRELFVEQYLSTKNKKVGRGIFSEITSTTFNTIVINNYITSQEPTDYIRQYMAPKEVKFKIKKGRVELRANKGLDPYFVHQLSLSNVPNITLKDSGFKVRLEDDDDY